MAIATTNSPPKPASEPVYNPRGLDQRIPLPPAGMAAEEHTYELQPSSLPGVMLRLALKINTRQSARVAGRTDAQIEQGSSSPKLSMVVMEEGQAQFKPLTPYVRELVLSNLDYFFETPVGRQWGDISLLKAGGLNHRLISRIRRDEGFLTTSIDTLFETMNKALRGELNPEDFRNYRNPAKRAASPPIKGTVKHGSAKGPAGRRVIRRRP